MDDNKRTLLRKISNQCDTQNGICTFELHSMNNNEKIRLQNDLEYLYQKGFIEYKARSLGATSVSITANGIDFFDESENKTISHNIFNIQNINAPSVIGNQSISTLTINPSLEELKSAISTVQEKDKELLNELISSLESIISSNQPIEKGKFAKFTDLFTKYSNVAFGFANLLVQIFTAK